MEYNWPEIGLILLYSVKCVGNRTNNLLPIPLRSHNSYVRVRNRDEELRLVMAAKCTCKLSALGKGLGKLDDGTESHT